MNFLQPIHLITLALLGPSHTMFASPQSLDATKANQSIVILWAVAVQPAVGVNRAATRTPVRSESISSEAVAPHAVSWWALGVSIVSLGVAAVTGYFQWRTHISKKPVVGITIDTLPPYDRPSDRTLVSVKNVGTAATTRELSITVSCSWMPLISYRLNLPTEKYCLEPSEDFWWELKLNEDVVPNSTVRVTVWDSDRDHWERIAVLNTPINVSVISASPPSVARQNEHPASRVAQ
jgi:hypothetical protein